MFECNLNFLATIISIVTKMKIKVKFYRLCPVNSINSTQSTNFDFNTGIIGQTHDNGPFDKPAQLLIPTDPVCSFLIHSVSKSRNVVEMEMQKQ